MKAQHTENQTVKTDVFSSLHASFSNLVSLLLIAVLGIITNHVFAQDNTTETSTLQIILPTEPGWNVLEEGKEFAFKLKSQGGKSDTVYFSIAEGRQKDMIFDSLGRFVWTPSYDMADRINTLRSLPVVFEATNTAGESVTKQIAFKIVHVNRPPEVDELRPFYVQYKTQNTYQIDMNAVRDPDSDPTVIVPAAEQMPEGMKISASGEVTWNPSQTQFNFLGKGARYIEFYVEDQPAKARTKGRIKLEITQTDLPPEITVVPNVSRVKYKENTTINIKFFLSDPNGDDDLSTFSFVSDNRNISQNNTIVKNAPTSYEFIWTPSYDFVQDPFDSLAFDITFYVLDKARNRAERKIHFNIENTINEAERDAYNYALYRSGLVNAWGLLEQMKEKEEELKKGYRRAKKGKKNRSVVNASLGATTGLAPVIAGPKKPSLKTGITTVGGTTVMTIGTLEATEVIGRSTKDLLDRFNYVMEKKSELQNKGDIFAREYSLKSARRTNDFIRKLDEFRALMNLKGLVALELDANWENKKEATDKALKRAFKDFSPLESTQ
ncbi:hypothetical protein [Persicitalea jodogahamensis]|uniref:Uncharacterized protein n=1 Tax=Persicitalea jodogahamensis TaxID=402147 RepID=A0A8J3DEN0_9BACT|nr:hypothetical protein [Persicitalea jodogahamensis]GHB84092.1 hypothetical protein GCM10007390_44090 [Persicitalea jodogahamensis]